MDLGGQFIPLSEGHPFPFLWTSGSQGRAEAGFLSLKPLCIPARDRFPRLLQTRDQTRQLILVQQRELLSLQLTEWQFHFIEQLEPPRGCGDRYYPPVAAVPPPHQQAEFLHSREQSRYVRICCNQPFRNAAAVHTPGPSTA